VATDAIGLLPQLMLSNPLMVDHGTGIQGCGVGSGCGVRCAGGPPWAESGLSTAGAP
jgi:hypothetical protein